MDNCIHNDCSMYAHGFYCHDCGKFFHINSPTYRSTKLLTSIWMVLHNINVELYRSKRPRDIEVTKMKNKIGIGLRHDNYEELIAEAEVIMNKYNKTAKSASILIE